MMVSQTELKKLQNAELALLDAFLTVCGQLNTQYYLMGGTMLGAIRHQGFIPWDDDIDVGMPRKDYELFLARAQQLLPEYYFLQTNATDPACPLNFAKLRDSRTTFVETSVRTLQINHGVYLDIFPLDLYPDGMLARKWFRLMDTILTKRINRLYTPPADAADQDKSSAAGRIAQCVGDLLYPDGYRAVRQRDKLMSRTQAGSMLANHCGAWGEKEIVPAWWYGEGAEAWFEGRKVFVPKEYDRWLKQVYGNYMQLPPKEKQRTHHHTEKIDLDTPYADAWPSK